MKVVALLSVRCRQLSGVEIDAGILFGLPKAWNLFFLELSIPIAKATIGKGSELTTEKLGSIYDPLVAVAESRQT